MPKTARSPFAKAFMSFAAAGVFALTSGTGHAQSASEIDQKMTTLASQLSARINGAPGWRVAVLPFVGGSGVRNELSEYMVRSLCTQLINQSSVDIVERQLLSTAMGEMKLQKSMPEAFDRQSIVTLGKLLGANAVITGSATIFQDVVSIQAVVIDVEKGLNIGAGSVYLQRNQRISSTTNSVTPDRQLHEPVLAGPRVQQFRTHSVQLARFQNYGNGRVGVWLRYTPSTNLSYAVLQGSNECTAHLTTEQGHILRCVRSTLRPLSAAPNGMPLSGEPVMALYEFEGYMEPNARCQLTAVNSIVPVLLSNPVRNIERVTVSFTDLSSS